MKPFWNTRKIETLRALVGTHTIRELAEFFDTSMDHISHTLEYFNIKRTPEQARYVQGKNNLNGNQAGKNNGNWKGGISKDNYHYKKLQKERYPERIKARSKVNRAIRSGKLRKENCKFCGTDQNIQAHIKDYDKPVKSVVWCCRQCNIIHHHSKNPESTFFRG